MLVLAGALSTAQAAEFDPGWLQVRDPNPFVLGSGLPLAPTVPRAQSWQIDTTLTIANTELEQFSSDSSLLFDAETHETRFSAAYAFDDHWSLRASISHLWLGDGFLDGTIENYHRLFGFTNGDRGQLGTMAPTIEVQRNNATLFNLDRAQSGAGPLLIDLTRSWQVADTDLTGISLGVKLPTGSESGLADTGSTDFSISAFTMFPLGDRMTFGGRVGVLVQTDNQLLGDLARKSVPFAGALLRIRIDPNWSVLLQTDAHGELYRDLPDFLSDSNLFSFGLSRRFGKAAELQFSFGEDIPSLRTTDIAFNLNLRINLGK